MVSLSLNFGDYKGQIRQVLSLCLIEMEDRWDFFRAAWLAYALYQDGETDNPLLSRLVEQLNNWSNSNATWDSGRNLGPLCLTAYLHWHMGLPFSESERLKERLRLLNLNHAEKFSPLNDPEQVFLISLWLSTPEPLSDSKLISSFVQATKRLRTGTVRRQILFDAARHEVGSEQRVAHRLVKSADIGDIIAVLWYRTRYGGAGNKIEAWRALDSVRGMIALTKSQRDYNARVLSWSEIALLYEALTRELNMPDPFLCFELYPLHPRIRELTENAFKSGEFGAAVETAAKALNSYIQEKTGISDKAEAELIQSVMMPIAKPRLAMNPFLQTESGKNEQGGLYAIGKGIFTAFRNPKAHSSTDHPLVTLNGHDALDQLVMVSYMYKRVERAQLCEGK